MNETPIDPDVVELLDELVSPGAVPVPAAELTADQLRQGMRDAIALFVRDAEPVAVYDVRDAVVPGGGGDIPVRLYSPETPTSVLVYLHGGAWNSGDIDTHDLVTRRLSRDTGAVVVSVDYRMLPEHPFPAPFDDAYDATVWAAALRPDLPLLVAGDSAGGTLAACVALRARDEDGPRIDGQVLVYPGIDDDLEAPSMLAFRDTSRVSLDDLRFYFREYAGTPAALASPYALPGRATSLAGLPPAVVVVAGHDLLRSSNEDYARRLRADGVPVVVQLDPGLVHGWIDFAPRVASADRAFSELTGSVNDLVGRVAVGS
ncbi:alpha/beta hydrolase [Actinoplanes sp. M2I2]|uniref:alpha/beta hydrolase n=1 Tax=Actinoplanes sp. M2I2 TaxID=1734444 RepID=UPI002021B6D5|nr:alpha/beta hydrolase [Actinoplanes sp. M2I2]